MYTAISHPARDSYWYKDAMPRNVSRALTREEMEATTSAKVGAMDYAETRAAADESSRSVPLLVSRGEIDELSDRVTLSTNGSDPLVAITCSGLVTHEGELTNHISFRAMNAYVLDYLVSEGFPESAKSFVSEANFTRSSLDVSRIQQRVKIKKLIDDGQIQSAIEHCNAVDPRVRTLFRFSCQHFSK